MKEVRRNLALNWWNTDNSIYSNHTGIEENKLTGQIIKKYAKILTLAKRDQTQFV